MAEEKDFSEIEKVYKYYKNAYGFPPSDAAYLRNFARNIHIDIGLELTTEYLNNKAIELQGKANHNNNFLSITPKLSKKYSSTPTLLIKTPNNNDNNNMDTIDDDHKSLSDLELLKSFKNKIENIFKKSGQNMSELNKIMNKEYIELENRIKKMSNNILFTPKNDNNNKKRKNKHKRKITSLEQLSKISKNTSLSDDDREAAIFIMNTYFDHTKTSQNDSDNDSSAGLFKRSSMVSETLDIYNAMVKKGRQKVLLDDFTNGATNTADLPEFSGLGNTSKSVPVSALVCIFYNISIYNILFL